MRDKEEWREVPGWPKYQVSSHGRVLSMTTGLVMNPRITKDGYASYRLAISGRAAKRKYREYLGHTLVLLAFHGPKPTPRHQCRHHPDPTRTNNHVNNVQWGTPKENIADIPDHRRNHNPRPAPPGEKHPNAKLTDAQALDILTSKLPARALAEKHGISASTVYGIRNGHGWKHLLPHAEAAFAAELAERRRSRECKEPPTMGAPEK